MHKCSKTLELDKPPPAVLISLIWLPVQVLAAHLLIWPGKVVEVVQGLVPLYPYGKPRRGCWLSGWISPAMTIQPLGELIKD